MTSLKDPPLDLPAAMSKIYTPCYVNTLEESFPSSALAGKPENFQLGLSAPTLLMQYKTFDANERGGGFKHVALNYVEKTNNNKNNNNKITTPNPLKHRTYISGVGFCPQAPDLIRL